MAAFPSITPSYGAIKVSNPRVRMVQFGDGYESRLSYGLNQNPKEWSLNWRMLSESDADTIETFLDARAADKDPFDWTPPNGSAGKWVCYDWTKTIPYNNRATINATFRQVFEP
jgi:phage-related protein